MTFGSHGQCVPSETFPLHYVWNTKTGSAVLSTSEHYDVVVIGRSVAGLIAAALYQNDDFAFGSLT